MRQRPGLAPAGDLLFLLVQAKKAKEHAPTVCVPALRYGQTCVTPFRLRCGKTRFALRAPLRQVAANLMSKHWHSAVPMPAARTACRRHRHTGGCGRPARVVAKSASSAYFMGGSSYQKHKEAIRYPHSVLPLVPTPATVASCGARLHRRVQLHRALACGNVFERSAASTQWVLLHSHKRLTAQVARSKAEGRGQYGPALYLLSGGPAYRQQKVGRLAGPVPISTNKANNQLQIYKNDTLKISS